MGMVGNEQSVSFHLQLETEWTLHLYEEELNGQWLIENLVHLPVLAYMYDVPVKQVGTRLFGTHGY